MRKKSRLVAQDKPFNALVDGLRLMAGFLAADVRSDTQAEALRQQFCNTCRDTPDLAQRWQICEQRRCGLTRPIEFEREQVILMSALNRLSPLEMAHPDTVTFLNDHVNEAGCTTMALVQDSRGLWSVGYTAHTLRATLHGTIIHLLAYAAGYAGTINARGDVPEQIRNAMRALGKMDDRRVQCEVRRRAYEGVALARLARDYHIRDVRTVRAMINGEGKWADA